MGVWQDQINVRGGTEYHDSKNKKKIDCFYYFHMQTAPPHLSRRFDARTFSGFASTTNIKVILIPIINLTYYFLLLFCYYITRIISYVRVMLTSIYEY